MNDGVPIELHAVANEYCNHGARISPQDAPPQVPGTVGVSPPGGQTGASVAMRRRSRLAALPMCLLLPCTRGQATSFPMPNGVTGHAWRNGCTTNCPLLIYLHGIGGTVTSSTMGSMYNLFTGITVSPQETASGQQSWATSSSNSHYSSNLADIRAILSMPEVDTNRVYLIGFSNGGFFSYLLACTITTTRHPTPPRR
jgi:hypothetical protein